MNIPVNRPWFHGNEEKYLTECIKSGWISSEGPFIREFEEKFSDKVGRDHGIAVSSGSAALDLAIAALGIGEGDEVIMPAFTIISPALSVIRAGGVPVLVDSEADSWNMDVSLIESRITSKTKAILVVHTYGLPVDVDPVLDLCRKHKLKLIEDAAEMHGQTYKGRPCGSFGDVSIFSFYPNKLVTTGEGGMVVCDDELIAARCRKLRNLGFEERGRRFIHREMGWNYRMTNVQAALGLAQLEYWEEHISRKREIGELYQKGLGGTSGLRLPLQNSSFAENIYWVFGIVTDQEVRCRDLCVGLNEKGIGTRPFFWCMHEQPVFIERGLFQHETYPVAEKLARNGFYLPSGLGLTDEEIGMVVHTMSVLA